ncbi:MAG: gliding motility protein GldN [Prolixibacteraceae bacterium]|nr:gliding motility protein GldN [Prolixibacteraceae bacterium]
MKTIIKISLLVMLPLWAFSQQHNGVRFTEKFGPFNSTYKQENDFTNRKAVSYPYVREADVMWSKVTWEIIDLREKMNLPLYYPTDTIEGRESAIDGRKSLIMTIMDGIKNNQFTAFQPPFRLSAFEFDANMALSLNNIFFDNCRECQYGDTLLNFCWTYEEIKQILIKEVWYFDRKDSRLHNEIIGICPIREYYPIDPSTCEEDKSMPPLRQRMFWIYYPDVRDYFSKIPVYSMDNDKPLYTYDDLFVYRYFNSYFVQEANVYNDRLITDYASGIEAQLESERIKKEIFDYEQDLWEN